MAAATAIREATPKIHFTAQKKAQENAPSIGELEERAHRMDRSIHTLLHVLPAEKKIPTGQFAIADDLWRFGISSIRKTERKTKNGKADVIELSSEKVQVCEIKPGGSGTHFDVVGSGGNLTVCFHTGKPFVFRLTDRELGEIEWGYEDGRLVFSWIDKLPDLTYNEGRPVISVAIEARELTSEEGRIYAEAVNKTNEVQEKIKRFSEIATTLLDP